MDMRVYVRESLLKSATGNDVQLTEAKSVEAWWDRLPGKRRKKVVNILGMSKGKDGKLFAKLDADEQAEISAYYKKHKGKVEGFEDEGEPLFEGGLDGRGYQYMRKNRKKFVDLFEGLKRFMETPKYGGGALPVTKRDFLMVLRKYAPEFVSSKFKEDRKE